MANLNVSLELDNAAYLRGIKSADSATKQFGRDTQAAAAQADSALDKLNARTEKLATSFGKLKGIIIGAAFAALARSAVQSADAIMDLSSSTELGIGRIIELQNALQAAGGEAGNAGKLITTFYQSIDQAAQGSDSTQKAFAKVGVSLKDLGTLSTADLLDKTVKGFENITDPAQRTAISLDLFGKAAQGVNLNDLSSNMESLRGKFEEQRRAIEQNAIMVGNFEEATNNLRMAFLTITAPLVEFINNITKSKAEMETLITLLKGLAVVIAAAFAFTGFGLIVRAIGTIGRGVGSLVGLFNSVGLTISRVFGANSTAMKILRGVGGLVAGIAGGLAAAMGLGGGDAGSPDDQSAAETARLNQQNASLAPPIIRPVLPSKETEKRAEDAKKVLDSVKEITAEFEKQSRLNIARIAQQTEFIGKTEEEKQIATAQRDLFLSYQNSFDQLQKRRLSLGKDEQHLVGNIVKQQDELYQLYLKQDGALVQELTQLQKAERLEKNRKQEIKNIVDLMEQQAETAREIAEFQNQQGQAVLAAFEQVRAQREALALTGQREDLEKSIQNLRGTDQAAIKELFDLETQRKAQLEAIQKIQNLPFEGVGGMKQRMQEINDLYDQRRAKIEQNAAATKAEQDSFSAGWAAAGEKYRNNIKTDFEYASQQMSNFTKGFEDAFVKFVQTGKISFKDLANSMIADFARIQAQKLLTSFIGGGSGGGNFLSSLFGGFFANGGTPPMNKVSVVGERGPELFVPQSAGKIIPNNQLGMAQPIVNNNTTAVSYSIQAVDASSFRTLLARDPEFIHNVAEQGRRQLPIRSRR